MACRLGRARLPEKPRLRLGFSERYDCNENVAIRPPRLTNRQKPPATRDADPVQEIEKNSYWIFHWIL